MIHQGDFSLSSELYEKVYEQVMDFLPELICIFTIITSQDEH
jgi:hypothetical protein